MSDFGVIMLRCSGGFGGVLCHSVSMEAVKVPRHENQREEISYTFAEEPT